MTVDMLKIGGWLLAALVAAGCGATGEIPVPGAGVEPLPDSSAEPGPLVEGEGVEGEGQPPGEGEGAEGEGQPPVEGEGAPGGCQYPADCPEGDCISGQCEFEKPPNCEKDEESGDYYCDDEELVCDETQKLCVRQCEVDETCPKLPRNCQKDLDCPYRMSCHDRRCINNCETDLGCPADGQCVNGQCIPFVDPFTGDPPEPRGSADQVLIGVGLEPLDFPIGVSQAGYGSRDNDTADGPYNASLPASDRVLERIDIRVVVLDDGKEIVILLRNPLSWSTDYMLGRAAWYLQELTKDAEHPNGINYHDRILSAATHSHSAPARYWNLVPNSGFGAFGYDEFSPEMLNRYAQSFARAIKRALDDRQPGKFGILAKEDFDPNDEVMSDRRGENGGTKDGRAVVMRFDDAQGKIKAVIFNFGMHGTHFNWNVITMDAPGGVEVVGDRLASAKYEYYVPIMFFNGSAGDISPRGDSATDLTAGKLQVVGAMAWDKLGPLIDQIQTTAQVDLKMAVRRYPLSYPIIGYKDGEFYDAGGFSKGRPYFYGGFQCVKEGDEDMATKNEDGALHCLFGVEKIFRWPIPQFGRLTLGGAKINDNLIFTMPGEAHSRYGREIASRVVDAGASLAFDFGYSMDHHFYLMDEDDWLQGGYEPSMDIWGWKIGAYIANKSVGLSEQLLSSEPVPEPSRMRTTWWADLADDTIVPKETMGTPGEIIQDLPAEYVRGDFVEFSWTGGHPGVDLPDAFLERKSGDNFEQVIRPEGLNYDNSGYETVTIYRGDFKEDFTWSMTWEELFWLPEGEYRWHIQGNHYVAGNKTPYDAYTRLFTVKPAPLRIHHVATVADATPAMLSFDVNYPSGPSNDNGADDFVALEGKGWLWRNDSHLKPGGDSKRYSNLVGPALPAGETVTVTLTPQNGGEPVTTTGVAVTVKLGAVPLVTARTAGEETVTDVPDLPVAEISIIPAPAVGVYTLGVTDGYGNSGQFTLIIQ